MLIYRDFNETELVNTTTETQLFSFDLVNYQRFSSIHQSLFGPNNGLRVTFWGHVDGISDTDPWILLRPKMNGNSTFGACTAHTLTEDNYNFKYVVDVLLDLDNDKQYVYHHLSISRSGGHHPDVRVAHQRADATEDLSGDVIFSIHGQMGQADPNFSMLTRGVMVEYL